MNPAVNGSHAWRMYRWLHEASPVLGVQSWS